MFLKILKCYFEFIYDKITKDMEQQNSKALKTKKKYKKVEKKQQPQKIEGSKLDESSFNLTKTEMNDMSSIQISSISNPNISVLTQSSQINQPSTFLGSDINLKQDLFYSDLSEQYCNSKELIDDKQLLKPLKKYAKKTFNSIENISILLSQLRPYLCFEFNYQNKKQVLVRRSLKDFLKANKEMGEKQHKTIKEIFDKLYHCVGQEFYKLMEIVFILSQKERVQIMLDHQKLNKNPLLYYSFNDKEINFTLFDKEMRIFEFSSTMIRQLKLSSKQQRLWKKFQTSIDNKKRQNEKVLEELGQYQASSDEQSYQTVTQSQKVDISVIKQKLEQYRAYNLDDYQEEMAQKQSQFDEIKNKDDYKFKYELERLAEQISELQNNMDNYTQTLESVRKQMGSLKLIDAQKYKNMLKKMILAKKQLEGKLPITARKGDIFKALDKDDLIILQGETGSGKSTQLPQIMCEYLKVFDDKGKSVLPILITQPRKLATRTVAQRVASEMQQQIGGFVDYATSAHKQISKTARIIFKMDSLVLDELTADRILSKYSCLIIDEAHQRTISIDVILGLIKQLHQKRKNFKVIVTSASLDAKLFSEYFKKKVMQVSGRLYPVEIIHKNFSHETDQVKKIENVIKKDILLTNSEIREEFKGDILVFCSGVEQINILCNIFWKYLDLKIFQVYPLHGRIAPREQKHIFMRTKEYKLIFASRIAETSITINGVKVVVDPGFDREQVYDQKNRVSSRKLINISQSSAKQRAGRAGRTSKGFCFRLYSQAQLKNYRPNKTPEIENMALDTLVLRLKMLNVLQIFKFSYINKPQDRALQKSVETLQMIGALNYAGEITVIGRLLLQLRIEPFLGRAIVQAIICQELIKKTDFAKLWKKSQIKKLENIRTIVVEILSMVINSSNIFAFFNDFKKGREILDEIKFKKFSDERGDFFYLHNIYDEFILKIKSPNQLNNWIRSRFLNKKTLFQAKELVEEINETIRNFKVDLKDKSTKPLVDIIKARLAECKTADDAVLSCMMTSFCVNLCLYSQNPNIGYTIILQKKPVIIYGTSTLALLSKYPKWIICYQLKTNDKGVTYCQIAHEVNYNFLKRTVDDIVFEKLNLKQADKMNPYYQTFSRSLPTMVLQEISNEYINRQSLNNLVFRYLSIIIKEESNSLCISYPKGLKMKEIFGCELQTTIKEYLENYIEQKLNQKKNSEFSFNLMSNVFLSMKDGFVIKNLFFTSKEVEFIANGQNFQLFSVKNILQSQNINCKQLGKQKLKIYTILQSQYKFVRKILENYGLKHEQFKKQKKQTSLNAKIYMKFYTGKKQSGQAIFLYYGKGQQTKVQEMCEILQKSRKAQNIKSSEQKYRYFNILCTSRFKSSKNSTGIKCFNDQIDAFQLKEAIETLTINGVLPFNFKLPCNFKEFRQIDHNLAIKSEKEWQSDIERVFAKQGFKNIAIKVKGDDRYQDENFNNMQKLMKKQLTAELTAESIELLDELVKKIDGKLNLVGLGKIHFRYNFKQHIVKINKRAFNALRDSFDYLKDLYENQSAQLRIQIYYRIFGKVENVFISCRSPNRENLLLPSERIKDLFTPFIVRLESTQFNFLCHSQYGQDFLRKVEEDYEYRIYFGFQRRKNIIKVYCQQDQFPKIQERIYGIFEKYTFSIDKISYRGKGLNKVIDVIEKAMKLLQAESKAKKLRKFIEYKIIFKQRQVQIQGDPQSIMKIKGEVANLLDELPGSCHICMKNTEKPYRLFNCQHSFCWKCLGDYIEQSRKEENDGEELLCPEDHCNMPINCYDMKVILSTEEFESFSMRRVKQYIKKNNQCFFFCPTSGCDQIFQRDAVAKNSSFQCYICGKWFCSRCQQPHEHFTCKEWEEKLVKGQLSKFGYKKCKCGAILQKEMRQKTIKCKSCQEYLCWSCIKGWRDERDCQKHVKICKK